MEITVELLKFNIKNLNDRVYTRESFEDVDLSKQFLGQIGQDTDFDPSKSTHIIKDIHVSDAGDSLIGTIELFESYYSDILKENISEYVFRPRILGVIGDSNIVEVKEIISFDAVPYIEDSWYGVLDSEDSNCTLVTNDFKSFLKSSSNLSVLDEYMSYHLNLMNPSYYDSIEENIETISYHKELYDKSMLCMVSNLVNVNDLITIIEDMIKFYEDNEKYENCSTLNNYLKSFKKEIDFSDE